MKLRFLGILLALAVALSLVVACGGDDNSQGSATPKTSASSSTTDQTLKAYFPQLRDILTRVDDQRGQLNAKYPNGGADPGQTRQYLAEFLPMLTNALSDMKKLDVPSQARSQHDALVSAFQDLLTAFTSLSNDVQDINSASDLKAYFDPHKSDINAKGDRVNATCTDLQKVANSSSAGIDLKCSGASSVASPAATLAPAATQASAPGSSLAKLIDVQITNAGDHDHVVFTFDKSVGTPHVDTPTDSPTFCASGQPITPTGQYLLEVRFSSAVAHTEAGAPSVPQTSIQPNLPSVLQAIQTCDYEGTVTWLLEMATLVPVARSKEAGTSHTVDVNHP